MGYDHDNRVTNVVNEGTASAYEYDGLGDRVTRHSLQGTRHFVLDRGAALHNVLMEADTNGLPVRYYIWGARGLLAQVETNGAVHYFHADELGSTLALTDTNGAVVAEYAYSPYGEVLDQTGGVETPYTFGGGYGAYHEDGSLYYIKARYYAADLRRWLTKDPIGLPGGLNLYAYCHGDPVNFVDPWGWREDRTTWFRPDDEPHVMGLKDHDSWLREGNPALAWVEDHYPAAHEASQVHDSMMFWLTTVAGADFNDVNVPTMPIAAVLGVGVNVVDDAVRAGKYVAQHGDVLLMQAAAVVVETAGPPIVFGLPPGWW